MCRRMGKNAWLVLRVTPTSPRAVFPHAASSNLCWTTDTDACARLAAIARWVFGYRAVHLKTFVAVLFPTQRDVGIVLPSFNARDYAGEAALELASAGGSGLNRLHGELRAAARDVDDVSHSIGSGRSCPLAAMNEFLGGLRGHANCRVAVCARSLFEPWSAWYLVPFFVRVCRGDRWLAQHRAEVSRLIRRCDLSPCDHTNDVALVRWSAGLQTFAAGEPPGRSWRQFAIWVMAARRNGVIAEPFDCTRVYELTTDTLARESTCDPVESAWRFVSLVELHQWQGDERPLTAGFLCCSKAGWLKELFTSEDPLVVPLDRSCVRAATVLALFMVSRIACAGQLPDSARLSAQLTNTLTVCDEWALRAPSGHRGEFDSLPLKLAALKCESQVPVVSSTASNAADLTDVAQDDFAQLRAIRGATTAPHEPFRVWRDGRSVSLQIARQVEEELRRGA
jgi:hypothetical protein